MERLTWDWSEVAIEQFNQHLDWYLIHMGRGAAEKFVFGVELEIERLARFPLLGKLLMEASVCTKKYRVKVVYKYYQVVYYVEDDILYIADIWDCRRNPNQLNDDLTR